MLIYTYIDWLHFQRECPEMQRKVPYMNLPHCVTTTIVIKDNDIKFIGITPMSFSYFPIITKNDKYIVYHKSTSNNHIHTLYEGFEFIV